MAIKAISPTIAAINKKNIANGKASVKVQTVRILPPEYVAKRDDGTDIAACIMCGGIFCSAGDLLDVTEFEAADLVSRGHAEIVTA